VPDVVLEVQHLTVGYKADRGIILAVDDLSFQLRQGEVLGICGESGSGKSTVLSAIINLVRPPGEILNGMVVFEKRDLLSLGAAELRKIRGWEIGYVFQDPRLSFDQLFTIESHFVETISAHANLAREKIVRQSLDLLNLVGINVPEKRLKQYPFQMSGGMLQRVLLALALVNRPRLLLADEPTTSLDVTTQAGILQEFARLRDEFGTAIILVSHDIGVINALADKVIVMYAGKCVEYGTREGVLNQPRHPYTRGLLECIPRLDRDVVDESSLARIPGSPPDLGQLPSGCSFSPRCPLVMEKCHRRPPALIAQDGHRSVACYLYE
jgi:oligopeptide/dipeptide ABC transporter ATP-binding protein